MVKKYSIYLLSDPVTNEPRYVGQSTDVNKRYKRHCLMSENYPHNTKRCNWLKSLLCFGMKPLLTILETDLDCYDQAEKKWIKHYKDLGYDLVNGNDGGFDLSHTQKAFKSNKVRGRRTKLSQYLSDLANICNGRDKHMSVEGRQKLTIVRNKWLKVCKQFRKHKAYDVLEALFDQEMILRNFRNYAREACERK